jgi:glycine hydroxymethyltransferase
VFDYESVRQLAEKVKPKLLISGGTAYPREIDHLKMGEIAKSVGAFYLADVAHEAGLIAGGVNSSPFPFADAVTMTTHKTLRGPRGALAFVRKEYAEALDKSIFPGLQGGPHLHTIAGIAISLDKARSEEFKNYASQTVKNAQMLAEELMSKGYDVVSGGTDKHLVLIDMRNKNMNGWFAAWALEKAGIIVNRNTVPGEDASPYYPSGIRLGTPALTVRGMKEAEMIQIAEWIDEVLAIIGERSVPEDAEERKIVTKEFLRSIDNEPNLKEICQKVLALTKQFPL